MARDPADEPRAAGARFVTVAALLAIAASLAVVESMHQFPLEDATNNLTRYVMLDRAWFGGSSGPLPSYIAVHSVVGPYLGFDIIGSALVHLFGPVVTLHIIAALVTVVIPAGLWLLLGATGRANRAWVFGGVLLGMGFFTAVGFINYVVGVGAALMWLAAWWPRRAALSDGRIAALWLGIVVLYLLHLSAPLIALAVVWIDTVRAALVTVSRARAAPSAFGGGHAGARVAWRAAVGDRRTWFACGASVVMAVLSLAGGLGTARPTAQTGVAVYPPLAHKVVDLLSPFYMFSIRQAAIATLLYASVVGAYLWVNRRALTRRRLSGTLALASAGFLALYFLFPAGTPGTGYLDMRWLLPAFLLPFGMAEADGRRPSRLIVVGMLVVCVAHDAIVWRALQPIERELGDYHTVLEQIPPGTRVLPLIADHDRHGRRIFPYRHFAFWHVIERGGRVPGLFNGAGEGGDRPAHGFLGHFVERDHLYEPGEAWGTRDFSPLDWTRIAQDYDYIVEAGTDRRATDQIAGHAQRLTGTGDVTLFRVSRRPL